MSETQLCEFTLWDKKHGGKKSLAYKDEHSNNSYASQLRLGSGTQQKQEAGIKSVTIMNHHFGIHLHFDLRKKYLIALVLPSWLYVRSYAFKNHWEIEYMITICA